MCTYFCLPSCREHRDQFPFFIFLALFCTARLLSPLTSVLSSLVLHWESCSCPSQMLFWALALPLSIAILCMVSKQPQISPCAVPDPDPALGRSSGSLQGHQQWGSHSKGSFVSHCWQAFTALHLCVQSFLSLCRTLCYCLCISPSLFTSRIFAQIPHSLWILMQLSSCSCRQFDVIHPFQ